jgi:hypothetical protein
MECKICFDKGSYPYDLETVTYCRKCDRGREAKIASLERLISFYVNRSSDAQAKIIQFRSELDEIKQGKWG